MDLLRWVFEFLEGLLLVGVVEFWWGRGASGERGVGVWACVDGGGEGLGGVWDLAVGHGAGDVGLDVEVGIGVHGGDAGVVLFGDEVGVLLVDGWLSLLDDFLGVALVLEGDGAVLVVLGALGEAVAGGVDFRGYVGLGVVVTEFGKGLGSLDDLVALDDVVGEDCVEVLGPMGLSHELGGGWRFSHIGI